MRTRGSQTGGARPEVLWGLFLVLWFLPSATGLVPWSKTLGDLARYLVVLVVVVAVHELGHAFAGRAFGYRIFEISFGVGPPFLDTTVGGTHLVVRPLPLAGHTMLAPLRSRPSRVTAFLTVLAGPFTNLVMLAVALTRDLADPWTRTVAIVNLFVLVSNLLPIQQKNSLGVAVSDGRRALDLLGADERAMSDLAAARYVGECYLRRRAGDDAGALRWVEDGLKADPGNPILTGDAAVSMIGLGRYREARGLLLGLLERDDLRRPSRALQRNNLAWVDLMTGDPGLLPEALAASADAISELPAVPAVMGTRGFALIEQGAIREGLALSRRAYRSHARPEDRAAGACVVAIGAARDGRRATAEKYLATAERLAPDEPLIPRARAAIAAPFAPPTPAATGPDPALPPAPPAAPA